MRSCLLQLVSQHFNIEHLLHPQTLSLSLSLSHTHTHTHTQSARKKQACDLWCEDVHDVDITCSRCGHCSRQSVVPTRNGVRNIIEKHIPTLRVCASENIQSHSTIASGLRSKIIRFIFRFFERGSPGVRRKNYDFNLCTQTVRILVSTSLGF